MRLIDADAVIHGVRNRCLGQTDVVKTEHRIIDMLNRMPTVDAVPVRHGKWENTRPDAPMFGFYYCSLCGRKRTSPQDKYCPNCGARMDEDE